MGLFDTVLVDCPKCQHRNEIQTKAGACDLRTYRLAKTPPDIAGSLAGETVRCDGCSAIIRFDVQFLIRPYVADGAVDEYNEDEERREP